MNLITSSSNFITRSPWRFEINLHQLLLEDYFCTTQKMHVSEYICKTCLKELGILLKCRETLEKFLAAWNSCKNFRSTNFLKKTKRSILCWLLWIQNYHMTGKCLKRKATFSKIVNPMKYPVQTYILVSTWNLLFMYFTGVSH